MQLRVKTKLNAGLAFLFLVIILIGGMGALYIYRISKQSKDVLKDNYETIQYAKSMMQAIDNIQLDTVTAFSTIEENLKKQENNITEAGEQGLTMEIRKEFTALKLNKERPFSLLKQQLYRLSDINMNAIVRKNNAAQRTADRALAYIGIIGAICVIVVFTFIINFPGYIADPIKNLTESIKQIAAKNYNQRLHFKSNDEFGELAKAFNVMAEELDKYENSNLAKIMFEKKRIETIINNMRDAIIGLNEKKIILFANVQATALLGLKEIDLAGKYAPDVALSNDLMRLLLNPNSGTTPIKIVADGKESYFNKESVEIVSNEKPIGEVILLKNITRFQELDLAKTNFIATISHELKTPIASIKLSSKLLEDDRVGQLNEEQQQLVKNIKEESERLLKITGEVLNIAQVETGKIQLNLQTVSPKKIIEYAVEALKFQAEQKEVSFKIECGEHLPSVNADMEKTAWVMVNLLSNALRYSPEKESIIIKAEEKGENILFSVQDFGKGIDQQYQGKIFDKYFRVPGSKKEGTGLGLAISKEFIEAQNGTISLESTQGKGSAFFFTLEKSGLPKTPAT
ncbi:MAG: ATP-binding protein [Bacteroidota bacterium]|nr:ATP-binding protein [Bacteroidota bacterium]